ncbi:MAG TPA: hypothetical protein VNS88_18300, partial [Nitrospiraceae bacterium]|nr:hypothetical protein [Nitrospiraceae bacterium]
FDPWHSLQLIVINDRIVSSGSEWSIAITLCRSRLHGLHAGTKAGLSLILIGAHRASVNPKSLSSAMTAYGQASPAQPEVASISSFR